MYSDTQSGFGVPLSCTYSKHSEQIANFLCISYGKFLVNSTVHEFYINWIAHIFKKEKSPEMTPLTILKC